MVLSYQQIADEIDLLVSKGNDVLNTKWSPSDSGVISFYTYVNSDDYTIWKTKALTFLNLFLPKDNEYILGIDKLEENLYENAKILLGFLYSIKEQVEKGYIPLSATKADNSEQTLEILFSRFHKVAKQLRARYNNRSTLEIEDEYDVQDLLRALLQLYFDDVRKEEWTPSYAGGCSREDFCLKSEKVVIEIKKTRPSMKDKDLGEQLIIDIEKYKSHPDCNSLICFIYDPEGRIENPQGIMNDLNSKHKGFAKIIIKPD